MTTAIEAPTPEMRRVAQRAYELSNEMSGTMNGLDAGVAGVIQTTLGLVQGPMRAGQANSMNAFSQLSATLKEISGNLELTANKVDAVDAANQDGLTRLVDPGSGGSGGAIGTGGSGMNTAVLT